MVSQGEMMMIRAESCEAEQFSRSETQCDVRDASGSWTCHFIASVLHLSCQVIYQVKSNQEVPGTLAVPTSVALLQLVSIEVVVRTRKERWTSCSVSISHGSDLEASLSLKCYLLTVEADGGDCVGVLSIFQTV